MRKLAALIRALGIVFLAVTPGIGAVFTMKAGDRAPAVVRAPVAEGEIGLVGTWVAMEPGAEEGALALSRVRMPAHP